MNIKKLLFLCLALSTACINADGWLYKAHNAIFGQKSNHKSTSTRTSYSYWTIGGIAGVTGLSMLSWLGWKKYSARKATELRRIEMDDTQEQAQKNAELLKKQKALAIAQQEYKIFQDMSDALQKDINDLEIKDVLKSLKELYEQRQKELRPGLKRPDRPIATANRFNTILSSDEIHEACMKDDEYRKLYSVHECLQLIENKRIKFAEKAKLAQETIHDLGGNITVDTCTNTTNSENTNRLDTSIAHDKSAYKQALDEYTQAQEEYNNLQLEYIYQPEPNIATPTIYRSNNNRIYYKAPSHFRTIDDDGNFSKVPTYDDFRAQYEKDKAEHKEKRTKALKAKQNAQEKYLITIHTLYGTK